MNGVSLENLTALNRLNSNTGLSSGSSAASQAFAELLAEQLDGNGSPSAVTADKADTEKQLLLQMCLMMCSNNSSMSSAPAMLSLFTAITGNMGIDSNSASTGQSILDAALTRLGDPYSKTYRGKGKYVDCSSLAQWAYKQAGISIPSTSVMQAKYCEENGYTISKDELQPGDLIFWSNTGCDCGRWNEIHHVAVYAGNGKIVEAKTSTKGVTLNDIWGENGGKWKIVMYARPYANGASSSST